VVVLVINPTFTAYLISLIIKATTSKQTKGLKNNGVGYPLGGQIDKPLDLTR
jgi:hypothetical protein